MKLKTNQFQKQETSKKKREFTQVHSTNPPLVT